MHGVIDGGFGGGFGRALGLCECIGFVLLPFAHVGHDFTGEGELPRPLPPCGHDGAAGGISEAVIGAFIQHIYDAVDTLVFQIGIKGHMQWRQPQYGVLVFGVHFGACGNQHIGNFEMPARDGLVQGAKAFFVQMIGVGLVGQQQLHHFLVALVGSEIEHGAIHPRLRIGADTGLERTACGGNVIVHLDRVYQLGGVRHGGFLEKCLYYFVTIYIKSGQ